ncbi:hypothetical protein [Shouchella lehensis]|uniref:Uncharacterized protein n=1 Tax=Shouchella lehensis G1 TaxID=1246626 RepID=A0A060LZ23_9BACI|nr:hypothetical protein [Shouchella lehensis]AIC96501.1 hypothetical protein BleG1_3954 [Shouchella lehensis G1]
MSIIHTETDNYNQAISILAEMVYSYISKSEYVDDNLSKKGGEAT